MQVTLDNILEKLETDESDAEVGYHHDDMKQLVICVKYYSQESDDEEENKDPHRVWSEHKNLLLLIGLGQTVRYLL